MMFDTIAVEVDPRGVATLTLERPEKHNALDAHMIAELTGAVHWIARHDSIRVVVLTGDGKSFCAGGDLEWMRSQFEAPRQTRIAEARNLAHLLRDMNNLPQPLIARINGAAYGGGMGMISVCDDAIAADTAKFGFTETRLGLVPATISPYCLARLGEGMARRVFMSGRIFDAPEARQLGLVSRVVPAEGLDDAIEALVVPYLAASPRAVANAKALARRFGPAIDEVVIEETAHLLADTWETGDAQEGISAFFSKRKPAWVRDD